MENETADAMYSRWDDAIEQASDWARDGGG
jgi:hypothetical protein